MGRQISPEAAYQIIEEHTGESPITVLDVLKTVFGRSRVERMLNAPSQDPEVVEFGRKLDAMVARAWERKGISRRQGPYLPNDE